MDVQNDKDKQILELKERYETLIEAFPGFIFVFDAQFFLRDVYMAKGKSLLHSLEELIGMDGRTIYSPEVSDLYIHNIQLCLQDRQLKEIEYHLDMSGVRYYFQARIVPYGEDKVIAMIQDIGDRVRRFEELAEARRREESNKLKSAFLANMSHEIRTPLNAIVGFSEVLMEETNLENREELMGIIRTNNNLLLQLVDDILDLAQIESGKIEITFQYTNINELIDDVGRIHQLKIKPEVTLHTIHPDVIVWAYTDPGRIKQVLTNLLSNAIKYTAEGSITLQVAVDGTEALIFSVADTGIGIEASHLDSIFDQFEKIDSFVQGSGLGLPISKSIVELLGGMIQVESRLGEGSTFSFRLPCQLSFGNQGVRNGKEKSIVHVDSRKGKKKKILVGESNENDYRSIYTGLSADYVLIHATNEDQLITLFTDERPDMVLTTIPITAVEASIQAIRTIRQQTTDLPVIVMTEHGHYTEQRKGLENGCNDVLTKPFSSLKIAETVATYV